MTARLSDVTSKVLVFHSGRLSDVEAFARPFHNDVVAGFREAGLRVQWARQDEPSFQIPEGLRPVRPGLGPTMVLGADDALVVAFAVFVGSSAGSWAIGKVFDEVYEGTVRPAIRRLRTRLRRSKDPPRVTRVVQDYWVDDYEKMIRIEVAMVYGVHGPDMRLVDKAVRQARDLIEQGAAPKAGLRYSIAEGRLTGPEHIDALPAL